MSGGGFFHVSSGKGPSAWRPAMHQQRVDAILAAARADKASGKGAKPVQVAAPRDPGQHPDSTELQIAKEVDEARKIIHAIGDKFCADEKLLKSYPDELQHFDRLNQILGHISNVIAAEDRAAAIQDIGMLELRARLEKTLG